MVDGSFDMLSPMGLGYLRDRGGRRLEELDPRLPFVYKDLEILSEYTSDSLHC